MIALSLLAVLALCAGACWIGWRWAGHREPIPPTDWHCCRQALAHLHAEHRDRR